MQLSATTYYCYVAGNPKPKGSMKSFVVGGRDGMYRAVTTNNSKHTKTWESAVRLEAVDKSPDTPLDAAISLQLTFKFLRPKSVSEIKRPYPCVKPDIDKLTRAVMDALTGIWYRDDAQVVKLEVAKEYSDNPGVRIMMQEVF